MAVRREIIEIVTRFVDRVSAPMKKASGILNKNLSGLAAMSQNLGISTQELQKNMTAQGITMQNSALRLRRLGSRLVSLTLRTHQTTKAVQGFNFAWLSVMFAGMALTRVFGGLIKAQLELFGITELMTAMWTIIFLPVMELITPIIMALIDAFMSLPEGVRLAIGIFILFVAAAGFILLIVGQVMLAIGGLAILFGTSMLAIAVGIGTVIVLMAGIAIVVAGLAQIVKGKLEGIGLVIMGIGVIMLLWFFWWGLLIIAVGAAVFFIIKNWDMVKEFLRKTFESIGNFFKKWFWDKPKEWLNNLLTMIKNVFGQITSIFSGSLFGGVISLVGGLLGSFQTGGIVSRTGPYLLHRGETVVPTGQGSASNAGININATYNVSVADKREFENMLRANNIRLAEDIRRTIKT